MQDAEIIAMLLLMCSAVLIVFLGVVDLLGKDKMAFSMMEAEFKALSELTHCPTF